MEPWQGVRVLADVGPRVVRRDVLDDGHAVAVRVGGAEPEPAGRQIERHGERSGAREPVAGLGQGHAGFEFVGDVVDAASLAGGQADAEVLVGAAEQGAVVRGRAEAEQPLPARRGLGEIGDGEADVVDAANHEPPPVPVAANAAVRSQTVFTSQ